MCYSGRRTKLLGQEPLLGLKQKMGELKEMPRAVEDRVGVKIEDGVAEIREQLKVTRLLLASGGSADLASWISYGECLT